MKICRFNRSRIGVIVGESVHDVTSLFDLEVRWPLPLGDLVITQLNEVLPLIEERVAANDFDVRHLSSVRLECPVANPSKIIGAPVNYRAHIEEANADQTINHGKTFKTIDHYGLFLKANTCLIGPHDRVRLRFPDRRNDHEIELAVIIGKGGEYISRADALSHVLGYAIGLDMTARGGEFPGFRKSPDTYGVLGPWITTRDAVNSVNALDLRLAVNGEERQRSNTSNLIFDVEALIEYASSFYSLCPGDIIMTGTPAGVSQVFPGDVLDASIEGLGSMRVQIDEDWHKTSTLVAGAEKQN